MVSEGYGLNGRQKRKTMTWRPDPGMTKRQIKEEKNTQACYSNAEYALASAGWTCYVCGVCGALKRDYAEPNLRLYSFFDRRSCSAHPPCDRAIIRLDKLQRIS